MPHFYGAIGAPKVGHHQWQPHSRRPLVIGDGRGSREARLILQGMRRREPPHEWVLRVTAGILTVVVHLLALVLMALRPPAYLPPAGSEQVASVEVRLIDQPEPPPPPPPPPPIELPKRKVVRHVAKQVPPTVKRAPVAAMPPVPTPAPAMPKVTLTPGKPRVAVTPSVPTPPHASASPPATEQSPVAMPPPPKVVEEISRRAVPPPRLQAIQVAPVKVPSPGLQPVPASREAPVVTLGKSSLDVSVPEPEQASPPVSAKVTAATPSLPSVEVAPTVEPVTPSPVPAPSIATPVQAPQVVKAPTASLAPIPQAPATTAAPRLNLPVADVPAPQAPQVEAPAVQVQMPSVTATRSAPTAQATSTAVPRTAHTGESASWAPASDQFKPGTRHAEKPVAGTNKSSQQEGVVQLLPRGNSDVMTRRSDRLGYKPTIFDQYWAPDNESILDTFLRRFIEKLSVKHTFQLAPGVRLHCVLGPMAVFVGCGIGDGPRPKPPKSNDKRLNMAPARSLVPGLGSSTPARPSTTPTIQIHNSTQCAIAQVAGSPPPPGCPGAPPPPSKSDVWH